MSVDIPLRGDLTFFDLQVTLDEVTYTLEFRWNARLGAWFFHILDETGEVPYAVGLRVVVEFPMAAYAAERKPPGILFFDDTSNQFRDIVEREELGNRVQLVYFTEAEIAEGVAAFDAAAAEE